MSPRGPVRWACVALGSLVLVAPFPRSARADGSGDNKAAAQVLFERARELVERDRFAEACPQFAESQRLDPGLGTLLWLADCYENVGQTASAWMAFTQAAVDAAERHDPREGVARDRASKLETSLSHLTIFVSPEAAAARDVQIRCDGVVLSQANRGRPIPLDPGSHTITANAADGPLWWKTLSLAAGSNSEAVTVPALGERAPDPVAPVAPAIDPATQSETPAAARGRGHAQRVAAVTLGGAGAASLLVGTFFSFRAKARYDASNAGPCHPDNECTAAGFEDRHDASTMAAVATGTMVGGAALIAGGAALYLTATSDGPVKVAFTTTAGGGAVDVHWRW